MSPSSLLRFSAEGTFDMHHAPSANAGECSERRWPPAGCLRKASPCRWGRSRRGAWRRGDKPRGAGGGRSRAASPEPPGAWDRVLQRDAAALSAAPVPRRTSVASALRSSQKRTARLCVSVRVRRGGPQHAVVSTPAGARTSVPMAGHASRVGSRVRSHLRKGPGRWARSTAGVPTF